MKSKHKLLFIPIDYPTLPYGEWFEAFEEYFTCAYYEGQQQAIEFDAEYIFVISGAISAESLKELKNTENTVIQWSGDCRDELLPPVMAYKEIADITCIASGIAQNKMYRDALGHPVGYLQHAVGESQFMPVSEYPYSDIVFIGNYYDQFPGGRDRNELCKLLSKEFPERFGVYGSGFDSPEFNNRHPLPWKLKANQYNKSFISISDSIFNDEEGYWSDRPLEIMAAGGCCLMRYIPNLERTFTDGEHCIFYRTNEEAVEKIKSLTLSDRNRIAKNGQDLMKQCHTYEERVEQLLEIILQ